MNGIVVKSLGSSYLVMDGEGSRFECRLKGRFRIQGIRSTNPVAVGDRVEFDWMPDHQVGVIRSISERHNYIIRKSINLSKQSHIIAANIDQLLVIAAIEQPRTSTGFIDRVFVTAEAYHIPATVVFNKTDLYGEASGKRYLELMDLYKSLGYGVLATSALSGEGVEQFSELLRDKTTLLAGHSGVGKSALINKADPNLKLKTGLISNYHNKGMHTTTFAEMFPLSFGGFIIDTPGIKEFGLVHFESTEVAERFPEFRELMSLCRYSNCTHVHEPGCAVKEALSEGVINKGRYVNYLGILNDENLDEMGY
jgi:ribosome biogenesis GTPase / thiamine phosphate phosphatase